jgi:hypothetical protein
VTEPLATIHRRARWMYWVLAAALALELATHVIPAAVTDAAAFLQPSSLLTSLSWPLTFAGLAGLISTLMLANDASAIIGLDPDRQARVTRAVRRFSLDELPHDERDVTRLYARADALRLRYSVVQFVLLMSGTSLSNAANLVEPEPAWHTYNVISLIFVATTTAVAAPWVLHRAHRFQRFAEIETPHSLRTERSPRPDSDTESQEPTMTQPSTERSVRPLKIVLGAAAASLVVALPLIIGVVLGRDVPDDSVALWVAVVALPTYLAILAAPVLGFIAASWAVDPHEPAGRRAFMRLVIAAVAIVVILVIALAIGTTLGRTSAMTAALIGTGTALALAGSIWAGEFIRQRDAARPRPDAPVINDERAHLRRKARRIPRTFVAALGVLAVALTTTWLVTGNTQAFGAPVVVLGLAVCTVAAGIASVTITIPATFQTHELLGTDPARQKRIARAVRKRSLEHLPHDEQVAAKRYAARLVALQPFTLAQAVLGILVVVLLRLSNLMNPEASFHPFDIALIGGLVIVLAAAVPFQRRQTRLMRAFVHEPDAPSPRID